MRKSGVDRVAQQRKNKRNNSRTTGRKPSRKYSRVPDTQYRESRFGSERHGNRSSERLKRLQERSSARLASAFHAAVVIAIVVFCVQYLRVNEVQVIDPENPDRDYSALSESAYEQLSSWWGAFSLFNRESFTEQLLSVNSREVRAVESIEKQTFGPLIVEIEPRSAYFTYSRGSADDARLFLDVDGFATSDRHLLDTDRQSLPHIVDATFTDSSESARQSQFLPTQTTQYIARFHETLKNEDIAISSYDVTESAIREIYINLDGVEYSVRLHLDTSPERVAGDLAAALRLFEDGEADEPRQYLDLRIEGEGVYQ